MNAKNISVVGGAGDVGLVTGLRFTELGHGDTNVNISGERVKRSGVRTRPARSDERPRQRSRFALNATSRYPGS
ncbi:MAG: hypothetical protein ABEL51_14370 [Salinibacter sp.]